MYNASGVASDPVAEADVVRHEVYDSGNEADVSADSDSDSDQYVEVLEDSDDSEIVVNRSDDEDYARNGQDVYYHGQRLYNFSHEYANVSDINGSDSDSFVEILEDVSGSNGPDSDSLVEVHEESHDSEVIVDRSDHEVFAHNGAAVYHYGHQLKFNQEDDVLDDGNGSDLFDELVDMENNDPLDGVIDQSVAVERLHELNNFDNDDADVSVINDSDSDSYVEVLSDIDDGELIVDRSDDEVYVHNGHVVYYHRHQLNNFIQGDLLLDDGSNLVDELVDIQKDDPFCGFIDQSVVVEHVPFVDWHEIVDSVDRYR